MDLLNQSYNNYNSKPEKSKGSKIITALLIVCILLVVLIVSLMFYLKSTQAPKRILDVNGAQIEIAPEVMISDSNGIEYMSLKDLSDTLGYKYNNGAFREYEEDKRKCYIDNKNEIIGFSVDSTLMYKTTEKSEIDYEYYNLSYPILSYQEKLYIATQDIGKALNVLYNGTNPNLIVIRTTENMVETKYNEELKTKNYNLTTDKNNMKAIAYGMLIANRDNLWGVLTPDYKEIIGNKYRTINFDEFTMSYIVSNERNQYGIISTDGSAKVDLKYDSLKIISHEPLLYEVSKNDKYGIMKKDGTMLTDIEYNRIGYPAENQNKINYTLIIPDLDGKTGRTIVVNKDGKYGLIYLSNGKTFLECEYADKIYEIEELGELKYKVQVDKKTYTLEEYIQLVKQQTVTVN